MKIINGKHYVDGGPQYPMPEDCSACNLVALNPCLGESEVEGECPLPVESWTADQCADWLTAKTMGDWYFGIGYGATEFKYEVFLRHAKPQFIAGGQALTAALRAAVIAVAEKENTND